MTDYAVVEQAAIALNKKQSASKQSKHTHRLIHEVAYVDESDFGSAMERAIRAIFSLPDERPKALILSAHGIPLTGTNLEASSGKEINLWHYSNHFTALPANLVVYVSACFGGYPSMGAIQRGYHTPYVVGPLVDIRFEHANEFQLALLDLMEDSGASRRTLYRLIRRFNSDDKLRAQCYGRRQLFGMHDVFGNFFPRSAIGQLAAPVESEKRFTVVDFVRRGESGNPLACVIEDDCKVRYQANLGPLLTPGEDTDKLVGRKFSATFQVSHSQAPVGDEGECMDMLHLMRVRR